MKIVSVLLMFVMLGVAANAQDAKIIAEIAASSERLVKGAPFSADAISESVQTLADGNRIVRSSTSKLYRNGEGRFRRETTGGSGGSLYTYGTGVTLLDPAGGFRYMIDPDLKTTRQLMVRPGSEVKIVSGQGLGTTIGGSMAEKLKAEIKAAAAAGAAVDGAVISEKLKAEINTAVAAAPAIAARAVTGQILAEGLTGVGMGGVGMVYSGSQSKWETRTEELGTQNIEGVDAEGKRTITTIPAGAIGNERPIEITYEKWYSRELQLVVMSKHNDPRFGEQTYRLTNIVRSEPDPSLFTLPNGYKMITEPSDRYTPAARRPAQAATVSRTRP